ncbi:MAG: peptidoglycan editing factor PgeF [Bryobacteraceae bacterium]
MNSPLLAGLAGFEHGFGTRDSNLSQTAGMASLEQIHSARVMVAKEPGSVGEADALITATPDLVISIRTADCFPILLADPRRRAVAAIHAGWRGTAATIAKSAIGEMRQRFGTEPVDLLAAIGPGIGVCCYRVDGEVAERFGLARAGNLDLAEANRLQLIESGVMPENIDLLGLCTFCHPEIFYSYRRDKDDPRRMISFIRIA